MATLPQLALRAIVPQVVPGSPLYDQNFQDYARQVNDAVQTINNYINNITNEFNSLNVGLGGLDNTCRIIASTTPGVSVGTRFTGGNDTLKLTTDGILVFCWKETTAGNVHTYYAKKAASPYLIWTSLDGTSQEATTVVTVSGVLQQEVPVFCEELSTGSLHFFYYDLNAGNIEVRDKVLPRTTDETGWGSGGAGVVVCQANFNGTTQQSSCTPKLGDAISTANGVYFIGFQQAADIGQVFRYGEVPWATGLHWSAISRYYTPLGSAGALDGDQRRLIDLGDRRILVLMEASNGTNYSLAYAVLDESTPTYNPALGVQPRTNANGWFLPIATSNIKIAGNGGGTFCTWSASRIAGTKRVGVVYLGVNTAASGNQGAGTYYTEFDADALTWTTQADIVRMSPADADAIGGNTAVLTSVVSATQISDLGGKCLFGTDGIPRPLWLNGFGWGSAGSYLNGISYRRLVDEGNPIVETDWYSQREVYSFAGVRSIDYNRKAEFMGGRSLVTIEDSTYAPIAWTRERAVSSTGCSQTEFCFKLLPVTLMDLP